MSYLLAESAIIGEDVKIGEGTRIWHNVQIRDSANIGSDCVIGKDAYIGTGVTIGDNSKIQNNASVYEPAIIGFGVFIGPGAILTNDHNPRAIKPSGELKNPTDWNAVGVTVKDGASIGAGAICVAPVQVGAWAVVGAGAVVTIDVPDFALVAGTPARQIGWVGKAGHKLVNIGDHLVCPITNQKYYLKNNSLTEEV